MQSRSVPVSSMRVLCYQDLGLVEKEIRRLLKCDERRTPVCLTTEPYTRFRCKVIEILHETGKRGSVSTANATAYLSQGLVARAALVQPSSDDVTAEIALTLAWQHSCEGQMDDSATKSCRKKVRTTLAWQQPCEGQMDDSATRRCRKKARTLCKQNGL